MQNILYVPQMKESQTGLEWHEGEFIGWTINVKVYFTNKYSLNDAANVSQTFTENQESLTLKKVTS